MKKSAIILLLVTLITGGYASAQQAPREEDPEPKKGFDKSKLFFGGTFGLSFSNAYTLVNVSPQIGYRFNDYLAAGTGVNFIYSSDKYFDNYGNDAFRYNYGVTGLNIFGRYEIQILDSYENKTYPDGQVGAIYGQTPPLVNAAKPPGQWQTYDIIFEAPRFDDSGKVSKKAFVTVLHNGVVLHHRREILGKTGHRMIGGYEKPQTKGFIELYEHGNPVRFRNIWIRPLTDERP